MPISQNQLDQFGFMHTHDLVLRNDMPTFDLRHEAIVFANQNTPCVYMWLTPIMNEASFVVNYIGKAGFGVNRRMSEHYGGFTHSNAGIANRLAIKEQLLQGNAVQVHARVSALENVLGANVSLYSTEEAALAQQFNPLWNRARFAGNPGLRPVPVGARNEAVVATPLAEVRDFVQGEEINNFVGALPIEEAERFEQLSVFLAGKFPNWTQSIAARGFTGQPPGFDMTPCWTFADRYEGGQARPNSWARIPLRLDEQGHVTVILPPTTLAHGIDQALIAVGTAGAWRPLNFDHFINNTGIYLRP